MLVTTYECVNIEKAKLCDELKSALLPALRANDSTGEKAAGGGLHGGLGLFDGRHRLVFAGQGDLRLRELARRLVGRGRP